MGIHVIKMPDIGEGIAEVELVAWNVKIGDTVVEDMNLADVMTDKATVEIPSPVHGKVLSLGGKVGEVMAVGSELIRIEVEGAGNVKDGATAAAPAVAPAPKAAPAPVVAPAPVAASPAPKLTPATARVPAKGADKITRAVGDKPIASPAVRNHAWDLGIDLQHVMGTGTAGRITHEDIEAYAKQGTIGGTGAAGGDSRYAQRGGEEAIPVIGLRRKIAQKMQDAKRRIPHFAYVEEIDATELESLRAHLNATKRADQPKLTVLPFIVLALVRALPRYPQINARFDDEAGVVHRHAAVHAGIATQTPGGLIVPVVRHAEARDLWNLAAEIARVAAATREGKAGADELKGSTITVTSLGPLGGVATTPVINHPEVAIIGPNKIVERPVVLAGQIVVRKMMNLSSSFDHRVVDGYDAAAFIQVVKGLLEHPATLFMDAP
jgi:2-oxoisovalerate dehydrogenase E2 component (dihydrolipoyl transacylase)